MCVVTLSVQSSQTECRLGQTFGCHSPLVAWTSGGCRASLILQPDKAGDLAQEVRCGSRYSTATADLNCTVFPSSKKSSACRAGRRPRPLGSPSISGCCQENLDRWCNMHCRSSQLLRAVGSRSFSWLCVPRGVDAAALVGRFEWALEQGVKLPETYCKLSGKSSKYAVPQVRAPYGRTTHESIALHEVMSTPSLCGNASLAPQNLRSKRVVPSTALGGGRAASRVNPSPDALDAPLTFTTARAWAGSSSCGELDDTWRLPPMPGGGQAASSPSSLPPPLWPRLPSSEQTQRSVARNAAAEHAVCLTGLERSFSEIGANVRAAVLDLYGGQSASVDFFGVRPVLDPWAQLRRLLPLRAIKVQSPCWSSRAANVAFAWLHCDFKFRGDCRLGALQELCDLQTCERMLSAAEEQRGRDYKSVLRLRADL